MILVEEGQSPLILCLPNSGTDVPKPVSARFNATGRLQADLSWRLERLFGFSADLGLTVLRSSISRYVIDVDKDPATPLAAAFDPLAALCPATTLDGKNIYQDGEEPGPTEIEQRVLLFHAPFHKALRQQVDRLMRKHGTVVLVDCQSMRSHIKGVTAEELPELSIGTADGAACDADLRNLFVGMLSGLKGLDLGVDAQTRGGFIVEAFGRPERGVHGLTLLIAQRAYLRHESPPFEPDKGKATRLQEVLSDCFSSLTDWAEEAGRDRKRKSVEDPPVQAAREEASPPSIPEEDEAPVSDAADDDAASFEEDPVSSDGADTEPAQTEPDSGSGPAETREASSENDKPVTLLVAE
ncbi:N-formylglutamate amidohydrolase [Roseibium sp. MMSF_3412]|uniref:N-formylglutamate amidohydrolase n=1 Tax=Roseibium sp. MMSF_3412 TaxID=3046712 RepID=UPI00273F559E|nr:N-formylglutamate amidohydrolase [Roseibium sp. MMSF_3412]